MDAGLDRCLDGGGRVERLGAAIKRYLARSGLGSQLRYQDIYRVWDRLVAPHADRTRIAGVRNGTLEVEVDSAPLMQELEFRRHEYVAALQAEVPEPFVERIHFRQGIIERPEEHVQGPN